MQKLAEFIKTNKPFIESLFKAGEISTSLILRYEIHEYFQKLDPTKSKMDRYEDCAERFKVSDKTVRIALKSMRKIVK